MQSLLAPRRYLLLIDSGGTDLDPGLPRLWGWMAAIAIVGSLIYGASLSVVLPRRSAGKTAVWLSLSAAAGWVCFFPSLVLVARQRARTCLHACLVTMAYGELVLVVAAFGNALLSLRRLADRPDGTRFNLCWVALSNIVMGAAMVLQMATVGAPKMHVLALWTVVLNGAGGFFFWTLRGLVKERT